MESLQEIVTGRKVSLFQDDVCAHELRIKELLSEARILVIGAAGSIGGAFVREVCGYKVNELHLVDICENNLVELVRDLRSKRIAPENFSTYAVDFTSPEMRALVETLNCDYVFNFSAMKHVRSERDPFTLMRMLVTNVIGNHWLCDWMQAKCVKRFFSVSSDKAVNPANLMGASKAFMERVLWRRLNEVPTASARFANVAYSDGSLLHSFGNRIAKRQPLSAPIDVKRYFITHQEAAQLCILAAFVGKPGEIFYPKMFSVADALSFAEIARKHLQFNGYEPIEFSDSSEAVDFMAKEPRDSHRWACYFSSSDTSGEKECEEFVGDGELCDLQRFAEVGVIIDPIKITPNLIDLVISEILNLRNKGNWTKEDIISLVNRVVPELRHVETNKNLDQKM